MFEVNSTSNRSGQVDTDTKVDNSGYGKVDKHLSAVDPLTLPVPIQDEEKKIKLNFYFLT